MASLPPALDFAKMEEGICEKWASEDTFQTQNKLSKERGDEVRKVIPTMGIQVIILTNTAFSPILLRSSRFTMDLLLQRACPITVISWLVPLKIQSRVMLP